MVHMTLYDLDRGAVRCTLHSDYMGASQNQRYVAGLGPTLATFIPPVTRGM